MKCFFLIAITVFCLSITVKCQNAVLPLNAADTPITKIFIVRHADKLTVGDNLSVEGTKRAGELKRVLSFAVIDSIFSTDFNRTKNTAKPLANFRGLPVKFYSNTQDIINRILTASPGKRVLIVGHSNTVAELIQNCGCTPPASIDPIPETQFDNLFLVLARRVIVNGQAIKKCELIHMKYGAVN